MIYLEIYIAGFIIMMAALLAFSVIIEDLDTETIFANSLLWPVTTLGIVFMLILEKIRVS